MFITIHMQNSSHYQGGSQGVRKGGVRIYDSSSATGQPVMSFPVHDCGMFNNAYVEICRLTDPVINAKRRTRLFREYCLKAYEGYKERGETLDRCISRLMRIYLVKPEKFNPIAHSIKHYVTALNLLKETGTKIKRKIVDDDIIMAVSAMENAEWYLGSMREKLVGLRDELMSLA